MSGKTFATTKQAEARARMASVRRAKRSRQAALQEQRRVSLVKGASRWQITNLGKVLRAMA